MTGGIGGRDPWGGRRLTGYPLGRRAGRVGIRRGDGDRRVTPLADALTPAGVRPFAPYRDGFYSYDLARASNPIANYALLAVGVLAAGGALAVGNAIAGL